jgi:tyrosyl-tRNA synthetase
MNTEQRLELIKQVGEEIITEEELKELLEKKKNPVAYDGFEPSGRIHIAQGVMRAINVNKLTKAGVKFKFLAADWHAWANNKLGGDLEKIQTCGDYLIEVWKACGMDMKNVEFVRSSNLVSKDTYWKTVLRIARENSVNRIIRCSQIMGRQESEALSAAQIFYPCMQAADIFELKVDIAQLGMDQRKVNMLARETGEKLGLWKPVAIHHHMLMGLGQPPATDKTGVERAIDIKMSKSKPDTAIFMDDSKEEIQRKIRKAYCPEGQVEENPILEYCKYIIFEKFDSLKIERPAKFGGDLIIKSYDELAELYGKKELFPLDLKNAAAEHIDRLIEPVRKHFDKGEAKELLAKVKSFEITR